MLLPRPRLVLRAVGSGFSKRNEGICDQASIEALSVGMYAEVLDPQKPREMFAIEAVG